jgi:hypothetical protein
MMQWRQLTNQTDEQLARLDVAEVNLACAVGLPRTEGVEEAFCRQTLDGWAGRASAAMRQWEGDYRQQPERFEHSWPRYLAMTLLTVLNRHIGIGYHPHLKVPEPDAVFHPDQTFIHSLLTEKLGTCASMPVVVVAVGRRMGFPLRLVSSIEHMFARWDDPDGERFNIECTCGGFLSHSDEHYLTWPRSVSREKAEGTVCLDSFSPREELASFLGNRSCHLWQLEQRGEAIEAMAYAAQLAPRSRPYAERVDRMLGCWHYRLTLRVPVAFYEMTLNIDEGEGPPLSPRQEHTYYACRFAEHWIERYQRVPSGKVVSPAHRVPDHVVIRRG